MTIALVQRVLDSLHDAVSIDHSYDLREWGVVLLGTVVVSYYGAWVLGDLFARLPTFLVLVLVDGYLLTRRPGGRAVIGRGLYVLAGFTVLIPFVIWLVYLSSPSSLLRPFAMIATPGDFVVLVVFVVAAGVLGALGRYVGGERD